MNAGRHKLIFSKRINAVVVVGENASSVSHASSVTRSSGASSTPAVDFANASGFTPYLAKLSVCAAAALLSLGSALVSFNAIANTVAPAPVASNTLPTGASVAHGQVAISQTANTLTVNQTSNQAIVNWNSFSIGAQAAVNIAQPSASSMHLSRVTGSSPSQILGQLTSNGQVVLVNPNGIVFGKDGSVSAASFTASTLGITDENFKNGNFQFVRAGANGSIVNDGKIQSTSGGYVALLGAQVTNNGTITTPQGATYLGAAEAITVPVSASGRIKLELTPAAINTSVTNSKTGVIVAEGGQVYMQAAALNDLAADAVNGAGSAAISTVTHSGLINTQGSQGGDVTLLTDHGQIKVDGSIIANSTDPTKAGGSIIIGRDLQTGVLAKATDASNARLETRGGFVETSADYLKTDGISVKAKDWLLDPANIHILSDAATAAAGNSIVRASTINTALNGGTSVVISTGIGPGSNSTVTATGGTGTAPAITAGTQGRGIIYVNDSILKDAGGDASLTLNANADITVAAGKTITSTAGKLNVTMNANLGGTGGGIIFNTGSGITTNGGNISLTGGGTASEAVLSHAGVLLTKASLDAGGGDITIAGKTNANVAYGDSGFDGVRAVGGGLIKTSGAGNINITGINNTKFANLSKGITLTDVKITGGSTGLVSITGDSSTSTTSTAYIYGVLINNTTEITSTGANISITGLGGGGTGSHSNQGISIESATAKLMAGGSGTLSLTGTGGKGTSGNNWGVYMGSGNVSTAGGAISITGTGGAVTTNNYGISIAGGSIGSSIHNAPITFTADSFQLVNANVNSGTGLTTIQNRTAGTLINVGGVDNLNPTTGTRTLGVSNAEINRITAGTLKIGSYTAGNLVVGAAIDTVAGTAITGNLFLQTGGTIAASNAITSEKGLFLQTQGGAITTSAALSGTNVSIDNTASAIDLTTGAINQAGSSTSGTFAAITIGGNITASENLNLYGVSGSQIGIDVLASQALSGGNIQATGKSGGYHGIRLASGSKVLTTGLSGTNVLNAIQTNSNGFGTGAFALLGGNDLTAAVGTRLELTGNTTDIAATSHLNTRGVRIEGAALNTSGDIAITGNSSSSNGLLVLGSGINVLTGSLSLNGTMTSNGGAGGLGAAIAAPIKLSNNTSLAITGHAANRSTTTGPETGVSITGIISQAAGSTAAGNITITGSSSTGSNSIGVNIAAAVSTDVGNIHIIGQALADSNSATVSIGSDISSKSGDVLIQAIGGSIHQNSGNISGKNITIENTGAGLKSLITDNTRTTSLAVGENLNGSIDSGAGAIARGKVYSDSSSVTGGQINSIQVRSLNASNNINITGVNKNSNRGHGVWIASSNTKLLAGNAITIHGETDKSHGINLFGGVLEAKGPISLVGKAKDTGDHGVIIFNNAKIIATSGGNDYSSGQHAISIDGSNKSRGTLINNAAIVNNSRGGDTLITGSGAGDNTVQFDNGAIVTNGNNAGAIKISATGLSPTGFRSGVGASNTTTLGALPLITQNSNRDVMIASQFGNVALPMVVNNGSGDVVVAAGTDYVAGAGLDANIIHLSPSSPTSADVQVLNPIISNNGGNIYLYSGSISNTGDLKTANAGFTNLALAGSGFTPNAQINTAYGAGNKISGGSNTQVLFRDSALPNQFDLTLGDITKVFGSPDPTGASLISALSAAYTASGGPATLSKPTGYNTFIMSAQTAINNLDVSAASRAQGESADARYSYSGINGVGANIKLTKQPSIFIQKIDTLIQPVNQSSAITPPVSTSSGSGSSDSGAFTTASVEDIPGQCATGLDGGKDCFCEETQQKGIQICYENKT